jgi:hypothetical protein
MNERRASTSSPIRTEGTLRRVFIQHRADLDVTTAGAFRVGVYVDGFNLYYGGRGICGRTMPGWRWLDLRSMAQQVVETNSAWAGPFDLRVVYCTARIKGADNPQGQRDQDIYLRALRSAGAGDAIEFGNYVSRISTAPLAIAGRGGRLN